MKIPLNMSTKNGNLRKYYIICNMKTSYLIKKQPYFLKIKKTF